MRESIVQKINTLENFTLSASEMEYIIKNWLEVHAQHNCEVVFDMDQATTDVEIDKESIFKSHI